MLILNILQQNRGISFVCGYDSNTSLLTSVDAHRDTGLIVNNTHHPKSKLYEKCLDDTVLSTDPIMQYIVKLRYV